MLADVPAGVSPAGGTCPVATVVMSGGGKGDRPAESPEVKVSVGRGYPWSDPPREASNSTGRSDMRTSEAPKSGTHRKRMVGYSGVPSQFRRGEGQRRRPRNWAYAADGLPGVVEDDTPRRNGQRKHGTTRRSPRPRGTARTARISRQAAKSCCAGEWGGWGRVSVDGSGQNNPNRSEGPWGRAADAARTAVSHRAKGLDTERGEPFGCGGHERRTQTVASRCVARAGAVGHAGLEAVLGKTRRTEFQGGRWKRRHHSKPGPRHRPTRPRDGSPMRHPRVLENGKRDKPHRNGQMEKAVSENVAQLVIPWPVQRAGRRHFWRPCQEVCCARRSLGKEESDVEARNLAMGPSR